MVKQRERKNNTKPRGKEEEEKEEKRQLCPFQVSKMTKLIAALAKVTIIYSCMYDIIC